MAKRTNPVAWLLVVQSALLVSGAGVKAATYGVEERRLGPESTLFRVYNRRTHGTIWTRRTTDPGLIRWSPDRAALAVVDERVWQGDDRYELLVWRNGERVRRIRFLPPFRRFEIVRDLIWSPDNQRLMLLGPYSEGEADQGFNRLWCLRLQDERAQLLSNEAVTQARWTRATRVRYWTGKVVSSPTKPDEGTLVETPHERTCR